MIIRPLAEPCKRKYEAIQIKEDASTEKLLNFGGCHTAFLSYLCDTSHVSSCDWEGQSFHSKIFIPGDFGSCNASKYFCWYFKIC